VPRILDDLVNRLNGEAAFVWVEILPGYFFNCYPLSGEPARWVAAGVDGTSRMSQIQSAARRTLAMATYQVRLRDEEPVLIFDELDIDPVELGYPGDYTKLDFWVWHTNLRHVIANNLLDVVDQLPVDVVVAAYNMMMDGHKTFMDTQFLDSLQTKVESEAAAAAPAQPTEEDATREEVKAQLSEASDQTPPSQHPEDHSAQVASQKEILQRGNL